MDIRTVAKIKKENLINNIGVVRSQIGKGVRLMAVVKADAYGHGSTECAKLFIANGADALAVATFDEAKQLRDNGITTDILVLGEPLPDEVESAVDMNLISTVYSADSAAKIAARVNEKSTFRAHLKIDTGMSRVGIYCHSTYDVAAAADEIEKVYAQKGIKIEGIFTHFACADADDRSTTEKQFEAFSALLAELKKRGLNIGIRHCSASSGILYYPEYNLDMVRAGISLYGYSPRPGDEFSKLLRPAMILETRVTQVLNLKAYDSVSYGATYTAAKPMRTATVSIGYGDGYSRVLSNNDHMLIGGKKVRVCGRVCMDMTMLDVSDIDCKKGDTVVVFGDEEKTADDVANKLGTISYEVLCNVAKRVPRIYV